MAYMQSGDAPHAIDAFKKLLQDQPGDIAILNNVASLLSEGINPPKLDEASKYARTAYDVAHAWSAGPSRSAIYDTLGWILVLNGGKDLDEGIRVLQEAVDEFPIIEAHYHLGEALLKKSKPEEAGEQLQHALDMINQAKRDKKPYDAKYESLVKDAIARANKLAAAAPAVGAR
jgi:tetratricopeptide (TPR) repeat protein